MKLPVVNFILCRAGAECTVPATFGHPYATCFFNYYCYSFMSVYVLFSFTEESMPVVFFFFLFFMCIDSCIRMLEKCLCKNWGRSVNTQIYGCWNFAAEWVIIYSAAHNICLPPSHKASGWLTILLCLDLCFTLSRTAYRVHANMCAKTAVRFYWNFLHLILDVCTALHQQLAIHPSLHFIASANYHHT